MHRRRFRRSHSPGGYRRKLVWAHQTQNFAAATSGQVDLLALTKTTMGITANILGITIKRVRISIDIIFNRATAIDQQSGLFLGIRRDESASAVVTPVSNAFLDWAYTEFLPVVPPYTVVANPAANDVFHSTYFIDNKAQRKLQEVNETYFISWATQNVDSAAVFISANTLIALP